MPSRTILPLVVSNNIDVKQRYVVVTLQNIKSFWTVYIIHGQRVKNLERYIFSDLNLSIKAVHVNSNKVETMLVGKHVANNISVVSQSTCLKNCNRKCGREVKRHGHSCRQIRSPFFHGRSYVRMVTRNKQFPMCNMHAYTILCDVKLDSRKRDKRMSQYLVHNIFYATLGHFNRWNAKISVHSVYEIFIFYCERKLKPRAKFNCYNRIRFCRSETSLQQRSPKIIVPNPSNVRL